MKSNPSLRICVFCSANELESLFVEPAVKFAKLLGERGHTLVWGGSDKGLMREVSTAAQNQGAKIIGISVEFLKHTAKKNADEMHIAPNLAARKEMLTNSADAFVVMVGGLGTLDELTEVLEHKKHDMQKKPVVILNTHGFYDPLKKQLEVMYAHGFLKEEPSHFLNFTDNPLVAMSLIEGQARRT